MPLGRSARDRRIAEIGEELQPLHARVQELAKERRELLTANAREDWPDGPFTLHFWEHYREYTDEFDTPLEALNAAHSMSDNGTGAPVKIADRAGQTIYDLTGYPAERLVDGYPEAPDDF